MQSLIIRRGLAKKAAGEDGPSFEQQFGILTNAVIADKFPAMDSMKLAFQLIEKTEDNANACGAAVYMVGKNVVFVPAFFKNNKLRTGDMMFIAQTQQFLPLADPWIAWLKNKDLNDGGQLVEKDQIDVDTGTKGTTIRDISDPIIKTASVYLKGLLHIQPDMKKGNDVSLLDTALGLGKNASQSMLDNLIKNTDFLNSTLTFYTGDQLDAFAKKAYAMAEPEKTVELILPLDKEAKTLTDHQLKALYKDGFFIRKLAAADNTPDVIRPKQLSGMFSAVSEPGKVDLLKLDGSIKNCLVMKGTDLGFSDAIYEGCCCDRKPADPGDNAKEYMKAQGRLLAVEGDKVLELPGGVMAMMDGRQSFDKSMLSSVGKELTPGSIKRIPTHCWVLFPDGTAYEWGRYGYEATSDGFGWTNGTGVVSISQASQNELVKPMKTGKDMVFPKGTRVILPWDVNENGLPKNVDDRQKAQKQLNKEREAPVAYVTLSTLDAFLTNYCKKNYHKARIYNNGSDYVVSGDKSDNPQPKSTKEAALQLVQSYNIDPAIAKIMLKEASNGASYDNPRSSVYYITKTAQEQAQWQNANIPMTQAINKPPRIEQQALPTVLEDPAQLQQAVTTAAQAGIKQVFDITALKLLIRQNHFFDEIHDDIPLFMRTIDSLCRKLFQFYWHTDKMEEKYGMVKMKALEDSLKCTLDSLSQLTIFFKLRTVDGTGVTGDTTGELMDGQML